MDITLLMAQKSFEWHEEDQYSFLWEHEAEQTDTRVSKRTTEVVFVKYDRDNGYAVVISYLPPEVKEQIYQFIHGKLNPWIKERFVADEEGGD